MENTGWPRTDLAHEAHRLARNGAEDISPLPGVEAWEERREGYSLFHVRVLDAQGAAVLGKPVGSYCTLEAERLLPRGDPGFPAQLATLAGLIRSMLAEAGGPTLVVGLGNADITPDALGPWAVRQVFPTRHLRRSGLSFFSDAAEVSVCAPGVLAASGVESAVQVRALCRELRPLQLIVIDALAGAEAKRLCCSVQVTDSGIAPGSGVGNDRAALSQESLGLPVLALGVPTVVDAACFGDESLRGCFVTPRSIDEAMRRAARLLGYAVDLALHPELTLEDLALLLE